MKPEEAIDRLNMMIADKDLWKQYTLDGEESFKEALIAAIQALEKQVAKKPTQIKKTLGGRVGECPHCKNFIAEALSFKGCYECLQKLDWSEE